MDAIAEMAPRLRALRLSMCHFTVQHADVDVALPAGVRLDRLEELQISSLSSGTYMIGISSLLRAAAGRELKRLCTPYVTGVLPEVLLLVPQLEELDIGRGKYADNADEYAEI